jgi:hypothetical protein
VKAKVHDLYLEKIRRGKVDLGSIEFDKFCPMVQRLIREDASLQLHRAAEEQIKKMLAFLRANERR